MEAKKIGVLAVLGASIMWAIEPILAKLSFANSDFLHTYTIRTIIIALIALLYVFLTNKGKLRVNRKQFSTLVYIALAGTIFADLLYLYSLTRIPVINAVLLGHMQPIFIVLIGFLILKEDRLTKFDYLGIFIMMIAGLFVTTRTFANLSMLKLGTVWDLLVLLATVGWATTTIATRKYLRSMNAGVISFYRFSMASLVFVIYLLFTSSIMISNYYQIFLGIVVGVGTILYYEGLKRMKAAQVSALELSTPFFASVLGFLILGESVTIMQVLGIIMLILGVYFISRKEEAYF